MQPLLARIAAVALLGAGFAVTGDLRRLAERATRFLNATTVPTGGADRATASATAGQAPAASGAQATLVPDHHRDAPLGRPVDAPRLPTATLDTVDLRSLAPGARVMVWVGSPTATVAFDVVDPVSGEVLEQSGSQPGGGPQAVSRRLRLEGMSTLPTRIDRGGMLQLTPLGVAYGGRPAGPAETLGPVRAIEVK